MGSRMSAACSESCIVKKAPSPDPAKECRGGLDEHCSLRQFRRASCGLGDSIVDRQTANNLRQAPVQSRCTNHKVALTSKALSSTLYLHMARVVPSTVCECEFITYMEAVCRYAQNGPFTVGCLRAVSHPPCWRAVLTVAAAAEL